MMTTNVTHRRPHRMPWSNRELLFDPEELRRLFPERIVAWMEDHPPPIGEGRDAERARRRLDALLPLRPFPAPDDLPGRRRRADEPQLPAPDQCRPAARAGHDPHAHARGGGRDRGRPRTGRSARSPRSAGSRTAASRATSRSTSSTPRCRPGRRSRSTSTASTPTTRAGPTRRRTSTSRPPTSAGCSTAGTGSTRHRGSAASRAS